MSNDLTDETPAWIDMSFVQEHARRAVEEVGSEFIDMLHSAVDQNARLSTIESPIEAVFVIYWTALSHLGLISDLELLSQKEITVGNDLFRADFVIKPAKTGWYSQLYGKHRGVVLELDGHEFHERTKEQVMYRNRRDRALQADGWSVLHLSGSELHRGGREAVSRVYFDAVRLFSRIMHEQDW